jgi:hypothetical protein
MSDSSTSHTPADTVACTSRNSCSLTPSLPAAPAPTPPLLAASAAAVATSSQLPSSLQCDRSSCCRLLQNTAGIAALSILQAMSSCCRAGSCASSGIDASPAVQLHRVRRRRLVNCGSAACSSASETWQPPRSKAVREVRRERCCRKGGRMPVPVQQ